ncbi:hypothetical protein DL771_011547 [Monosporascus sp. 5C6A]|nr:hypothetical protein DL771_011547 [Monosporascus sp. 5C6A]
MGTKKKNQGSGGQAGGGGKSAAAKGGAAGGKGAKGDAKGGAQKKDVEVVTGKPVKGAQRIEVRHIFCEKFSKWEEAYKKLSADKTVGNFANLAKEYNEDKPGKG